MAILPLMWWFREWEEPWLIDTNWLVYLAEVLVMAGFILDISIQILFSELFIISLLFIE